MTDPGGFRIASAFVRVDADDDGLRDRVSAKIKAAVAGLAANVRVDADAGDLAAKVRAAVAGAGGGAVHIPVDVDTGDSVAKLAAVDAAAHAARDSGNGLTQDAQGKWRNSLGQFATAAEQAAAGVDDAGTKTKAAGDKTDDAGKKAANAGNGFLGLSGKVWAVAGAAGAAGPALAALPAILTAGGLAAGTFAAAFAGPLTALKDHVAVTNAVGTSGAQLAATSASNAVTIRNSEQSIVDAKKASAIAALSSAASIASAEQGVADALRQSGIAAVSSASAIASAKEAATAAVKQAAISQQNSLDSVASAEERLGNAQISQQQAQRALTVATADATNQLIDLNNASADAHLNAEQAALSLTIAERNLAAVQGSSLSNPEQIRQAKIDLAKAQQAVADTTQKAAETSQAAAKANKEGALGLPTVVSAQEAYTKSVQGTSDAQYALVVAQRNADNQAAASAKSIADSQRAVTTAQTAASNQAVASAESVAKAQLSLAQAQQSADQQKAASAESVAKAVQSLADTQQQQALASAAQAASGATAANAFAKDMSKMTQAGRDFTVEALSWRDALHQLSDTAQTATLPGFTFMLQGAKALLPVVNTGVQDMGHQLSTTAIAFGNLFQNTAFNTSARQFTALITGGFGQFASALPPLLSAIVTSGVQAGPLINAVAVGMHDIIATGLPNFLSGLTVNASGAAQGVSALFGTVRDLLGPVGTLTGAVGGALGPALHDLQPEIKILADDILKSLLPIMPQLSDALVAVVGVVGQLLPIITPLIPLIATDFAAALSTVTPWLKDTAKFLQDNAAWLKPVAEGVLALVVAIKAWNIATGLAEGATKLFKTGLKEFSAEGQVATTATKAWGVATEGTLATLAKGLGAGGILIGAGIALADLQSKLSELGQTHLNTSGITQTLLDVTQKTSGATAEIAKLAETVSHDQITKFNTNLQAVDQTLAGMVAGGHADTAKTSLDAFVQALDKLGPGMGEEALKFLPQYNQSLTDTSNSSRAAALDTDKTKTAVQSAGSAAQVAQTPFQGLTLKLISTGQAGRNSALDLGKVDTALGGIDAQLRKTQALDEYNKALGSITTGAAGTSKSLQGNTQSAIDNRAQLEQGITAARHFYDTQIAGKVNVDDANKAFQAQVDALKAQAEKTYGSKKAVDDFMVSLGLVPPSKTTKITADTIDGVKTIKTWQTTIDSLHGPVVDLTIKRILGPGNVELTLPGGLIRASTNAAGGPVRAGEVSLVGERGPEYVQFGEDGRVIPNHAIRQVGPGSSPAGNGPVINLNYYGTTHPTPEQRQNMYRDMALAVRT